MGPALQLRFLDKRIAGLSIGIGAAFTWECVLAVESGEASAAPARAFVEQPRRNAPMD